MLSRTPWFDPGGNRLSDPKNDAWAISHQFEGPNVGPHKNIRIMQPARGSKRSQTSEAKLDDIAQRIAWLKEALRRKAGVEQEHGDLALQIQQQRSEVRQRERELAMELARVDNDLASFKAKLASLKSQQSAESLAVLQRASTPLAVEMQWAMRHAEAAGTHRIVNPAVVSPQAELLHPKPSEVIDTLEPGTLVQVVAILRVPELSKVRARIQKPLQGWISLVDLEEVPKRWAKSIEVQTEFANAWAGGTVEDCIASRSSLLRGWAAKVDAEQTAFFESLLDVSADVTSFRSPASVVPVKVSKAVRDFNSTSLSRSALEKALEAQTEQMNLDKERAGMELAEAESEAFMLVDKVDSAAERNRILNIAVSRLESFWKELASSGAREAFGLLSFWRKRDEEKLDILPGSSSAELSNQATQEVSPMEALELIAEDLAKCEQEAAAGQIRIDAMLRGAEELQRQRGERMQEVADLRRRFAPLRAAVHSTPARRELAAVQCRLWRIRQMVSQVASDAIAEIKGVEAWAKSLQFSLAKLLDTSAPAKVRCSWLSESIKERRNVNFSEAKKCIGTDIWPLQELLEQAKSELCSQTQLAAADRDTEVKNPSETIEHLEWVAEQLDEQRVQMTRRHSEELRERGAEGAEGSTPEDCDLIQLQLRHENESLQMARLVEEHKEKLAAAEARLAAACARRNDLEAREGSKDAGEGSQELDSVPEPGLQGLHDDLRDLQDCTTRFAMDKLTTSLSEALHQFRPCSGKCEGEQKDGSGVRSLWWLAANVAALTWFAEAELQDLGAPPPVDSRREFYSLADSRFARERRYEDEWRESLPPKPSPLVSPFPLDE